MFILTRHINLLAVSVAIAVLGAVMVVGAKPLAAIAVDAPPTFDAGDAALVGVILTDPTALSAAGISAAAAIEAATSVAPAVRTKPVTAVPGVAGPNAGAADRPVWVVVMNGGRAGSWGPAGANAQSLTVRLTGIIVDRDTGEVI